MIHQNTFLPQGGILPRASGAKVLFSLPPSSAGLQIPQETDSDSLEPDYAPICVINETWKENGNVPSNETCHVLALPRGAELKETRAC